MDNICHYTKAETAIKILTNQLLWASDYRFLDDNEELNFLLNQFKGICKDFPVESQKINCLIRAINGMTSEMNFYITSFTEHKAGSPDSKYGNLPMGRYFGGQDWIGLVFNKTKIRTQFECFQRKIDKSVLHHGHIFYHDPSNSAIYKPTSVSLTQFMIKICKKFYSRNFEHTIRQYFKMKDKEIDFLKQFEAILIELIDDQPRDLDNDTVLEKLALESAFVILMQATVKHIGSAQEKEFRLCLSFSSESLQDKDIIQLDIKPHLEIPFYFSDIESIIIGPGEHQSATMAHIRDILLVKGDKSDLANKLILSSTPWRNSGKR